MTGARFGNIATADLLAREMQDRVDLADLQGALRERLVAESGIVIGAVYRVADDGRPLSGRLMLVEGVGAGLRGVIPRRQQFYCFAWGRMNGRSAAGDGWTIKRQNVTTSRLTREIPK